MSPINPRGQAVLVNKLILVVLIGILGCLVVLVVRQNNFLAEQEQLAKTPIGHAPSPTLGELPVDQPSMVANRRDAASLPRATDRAQRTALVPLNDEAPVEPLLLEKPQLPARLVETAIVSSGPAGRVGQIAGTVTLRGT